MSDQTVSDYLTAKEKEKPPIPRDVSGVAYICTDGYIKYCTTGPERDLPADFQEWHRPVSTQKQTA
jgi:hypothetical protein